MSQYLERVADVLITAGGHSLEQLRLSNRMRRGVPVTELYATILFPKNTILEIRIVVRVVGDALYRVAYSFHYMVGEGTTIFRYDNSDHHPNLENPPHHKHEGAEERVVGCPQPSVHLIRDEIAAYLMSAN